MKACPGAIEELETTLHGLHPGTVSNARFSKFTRATAFPLQSIAAISVAMNNYFPNKCYDCVLVDERWTSKTREYVHPRNLFHHMGVKSTIPDRDDDPTPIRNDNCYERLFSHLK
jgi:hypothetical protein